MIAARTPAWAQDSSMSGTDRAGITMIASSGAVPIACAAASTVG